jgi:hypothetical protein
MPKLYFGEAFSLILKTLPFIWVRLGSYLLLGLGLGGYFAGLGGVAWLLGKLWAPLGVIVFLIAAVGAIGVVRWVSRYYFYLLKAGHTAVMTEFIVHGRGPDGPQIAYGREQVMSRFRDTSILFAVDALVDGVVRAIVRTFTRITGLLPIPGIDGLGRLLERVARASTTYIDEAVLSRAYAKREQNVWKVAQDGTVLYAQAWKPVLANAVALTLLSYVEFVLLLILLGLPAVAIGAALPGLRLALGIGVFIGAWMIKLAVVDAFGLAATLVAFHRSTENLEPDEGWKARLEGVSDKFKELGRKAAEAARNPMAPDPAAAAEPVTAPAADPAAPPAAAVEPEASAPADGAADPDPAPADDTDPPTDPDDPRSQGAG